MSAYHDACIAVVPELQRIIEEVCAKYGVSRMEFVSMRRARLIADARHEYFYRASNETVASLPQIGSECNRDHATVAIGIKRHAAQMKGGR